MLRSGVCDNLFKSSKTQLPHSGRYLLRWYIAQSGVKLADYPSNNISRRHRTTNAIKHNAQLQLGFSLIPKVCKGSGEPLGG